MPVTGHKNFMHFDTRSQEGIMHSETRVFRGWGFVYAGSGVFNFNLNLMGRDHWTFELPTHTIHTVTHRAEGRLLPGPSARCVSMPQSIRRRWQPKLAPPQPAILQSPQHLRRHPTSGLADTINQRYPLTFTHNRSTLLSSSHGSSVNLL